MYEDQKDNLHIIDESIEREWANEHFLSVMFVIVYTLNVPNVCL